MIISYNTRYICHLDMLNTNIGQAFLIRHFTTKLLMEQHTNKPILHYRQILNAKWNLTIFCIYIWINIGAIIARIQNIVHHSLNERIFWGQTQIWMYGWSKHISSNSSIAIAALHHPDSVLISNPRMLRTVSYTIWESLPINSQDGPLVPHRLCTLWKPYCRQDLPSMGPVLIRSKFSTFLWFFHNGHNIRLLEQISKPNVDNRSHM